MALLYQILLNVSELLFTPAQYADLQISMKFGPQIHVSLQIGQLAYQMGNLKTKHLGYYEGSDVNSSDVALSGT